MSTSILAPERAPERDPFTGLLRAEWTKLRTVRGWVTALLVAALLIVGFGVLPGMQGSCGKNGPGSECELPVGPGGEQVTDSFTFVGQSMTGDGSVTVRLASLTGVLPPEPGDGGHAPGHQAAGDAAGEGGRPGLAPWAKAGLIIKDGTTPGSSYAAVMLTGGHGIRMQYDYTHDIAGRPASARSPHWLRLSRSGDTLTGYESADGAHWTRVGSARLPGLPSTVRAGLFTTSPQYTELTKEGFGGVGAAGGPTKATGTFDRLGRTGGWSGGAWTGQTVGGSPQQRGEFRQSGGRFTLTGSGDIAPAVSGSGGLGTTVTQTLIGTFAGLLAVVVLGATFITAEYRRGLIRTTVAASPRRGRVLAAKAVVLAAAAFATGLVSAALVVPLGQRVLRGNGVYVAPATPLTEVRLIVGTAGLLAVAAVLALGIGTLLRRSATAVAAVIVVIVLPYLLAVSVLPAGAGQWLLRLTPAAGFAIQQSAVRYDQVSSVYTAAEGYFPLSPWAGFAVLCAWAALVLSVAFRVFRRRDV